MRAYCWRVGAVLDLEEGEKCPECGTDSHKAYKGDDCGNFFHDPKSGNGYHCALPPRHIGKCAHNRDDVAELIHES